MTDSRLAFDDDFMRSTQACRMHCVAVHRGMIECRTVPIGSDRSCEHSAKRTIDGNPLNSAHHVHLRNHSRHRFGG